MKKKLNSRSCTCTKLRCATMGKTTGSSPVHGQSHVWSRDWLLWQEKQKYRGWGGHAKAIYLPKTRSTENPQLLLTLNRGKEQQPSAPKGKESMDVWCRHNRIQMLGVLGDAPCLSKHKLIAAFCYWTQSLWSTEGNTLGETYPVPIPTADRRGRPITNIISSTLQSKLMTNIK